MEEMIDSCVEVIFPISGNVLVLRNGTTRGGAVSARLAKAPFSGILFDELCKSRLVLCGVNYPSESKIEESKMNVCSFFRSHRNCGIAERRQHPKSSFVIDLVSADNPKKSLNLFRILFELFEKMWIRCTMEERS